MNENSQKIERDLCKAQLMLNEHYCTFGKQLLEMAEQEDKEINSLVDKIIKLKSQLVEMNQMTQCPKCLEVNNHQSRYCSHCGNKL
jgi:uncharacterized protein (DUF305 family)